jgi:hypothetical protein
MEKSEINKWVEGEYDRWSATGLSPLSVMEQVLHPANINKLGKLNSEAMKDVINTIYNKDPEGLKNWVQDRTDRFFFENQQIQRLTAVARNSFLKK